MQIFLQENSEAGFETVVFKLESYILRSLWWRGEEWCTWLERSVSPRARWEVTWRGHNNLLSPLITIINLVCHHKSWSYKQGGGENGADVRFRDHGGRGYQDQWPVTWGPLADLDSCLIAMIDPVVRQSVASFSDRCLLVSLH